MIVSSALATAAIAYQYETRVIWRPGATFDEENRIAVTWADVETIRAGLNEPFMLDLDPVNSGVFVMSGTDLDLSGVYPVFHRERSPIFSCEMQFPDGVTVANWFPFVLGVGDIRRTGAGVTATISATTGFLLILSSGGVSYFCDNPNAPLISVGGDSNLFFIVENHADFELGESGGESVVWLASNDCGVAVNANSFGATLAPNWIDRKGFATPNIAVAVYPGSGPLSPFTYTGTQLQVRGVEYGKHNSVLVESSSTLNLIYTHASLSSLTQQVLTIQSSASYGNRTIHILNLRGAVASWQLSLAGVVDKFSDTVSTTLDLNPGDSVKLVIKGGSFLEYVTPAKIINTPTKVANYNAKVGDRVLVDPSGGTFTVGLPDPTLLASGARIEVKNVTSSATAVDFSSGAANIEDPAARGTYSASPSASGAGFCVAYESDGTNWILVGVE